MKKLLFTIAAVVFAFAANAQFVIGGNLGFNTHGYAYNYDGERLYDPTEDNGSILNFDLGLRAGYQINEKMEAGLLLGFGANSNKDFLASSIDMRQGEYFVNNKRNNFYIGAYFRYICLSLGKFNMFTEAYLGYGAGSSKNVSNNAVGEVTVDGPKTNYFTVQVVPGLMYNVNEHLALDLTLNFISLGFTHNVKNIEATEIVKEHSYVDNTFGFNFQGQGMAIDDLTSTITVGIRYRF